MALDDRHIPRSDNAVFLRRVLKEEREAHELLVLATDASLLGWGTWDLRTGETDWDERGRLIMGFEDDTQAKSAQAWLERIHPEDRLHVERHVQECMAEGKAFRLEYRIILPDGEVRHVLGTGMFHRMPGGTSWRGTGLVQDVTDRKKAQAERERLHTLEATSRAQAAERDRIGRELHDRVAHLMAVVHQSLELHEALKESDPQGAAEKMELARRVT